jgi:hypothetical protein
VSCPNISIVAVRGRANVIDVANLKAHTIVARENRKSCKQDKIIYFLN